MDDEELFRRILEPPGRGLRVTKPMPGAWMSERLPPPEFRRFMFLPWRWWQRIPHLHVPVFLDEVGHVKCVICWKPEISYPVTYLSYTENTLPGAFRRRRR